LIINNHSHSDTVANETFWTFLMRFYTVFFHAFLYTFVVRFIHY